MRGSMPSHPPALRYWRFATTTSGTLSRTQNPLSQCCTVLDTRCISSAVDCWSRSGSSAFLSVSRQTAYVRCRSSTTSSAVTGGAAPAALRASESILLTSKGRFLPFRKVGPRAWSQGRLAVGGPFVGAMIDGLFLLLFVLAWWLMRAEGEGGVGQAG